MADRQETATLKQDLDEVLDMATGANLSYVTLKAFVEDCDAKGLDIPFLRQFASLCRKMEKMTYTFDNGEVKFHEISEPEEKMNDL